MALITADASGEMFAVLTADSQLTVAVLCAAWCDTCEAFRPTLKRIAEQRPQMVFIWLDVEDDAALCGDVDVENFPTLAIFRDDQPVHFGVSLPHEGVVARLVDELAQGEVHVVPAPEAIVALPRVLRER